VEVLPSGFLQSFPSGAGTVVTNQVGLGANGYAITLTSGQADAGNDFGNFRIPASKLLLTGRNLSNLLDGTFLRQASFVADLYQTMLGRAPDLAGLEYYLRLMQAGFSRSQIASFIAGTLPGQ
jgi:hypothetical protein